MDDFAGRLTAAMAARGIGVRALARRVHCDPGLISRLAAGKQNPSPKIAELLDDALGTGGTLTGSPLSTPPAAARPVPGLDELAAIEISRRASSTSVGELTVGRLEQAVDDLAVSYPHLGPGVLLQRVRGYLDYATGLLDGKVTLGEHRRLLVTTGWLSLLSATCLIDLREFPAAVAYLRTAAELARETGHAEIAAWALETKAWQLVTDGEYERAVALSQAAQRTAPREGSAIIQATAQEARAWARLGSGRETRAALARAEALASPLPQPDRPEHHYRYDPGKAETYIATTLAWTGDPAAAGYARDVLGRLEAPAAGPRLPRRVELARLDLALALTASGELDEAAGMVLTAVTSGLLVPSNSWRADEVITAISERDVAAVADLRDAFDEFCPPARRALPPGG
ncbi:MAG: helix-turn-helix domain-containing protein [Streptosporangiaceae bacterium]